jgi:hypothetical protein
LQEPDDLRLDICPAKECPTTIQSRITATAATMPNQLVNCEGVIRHERWCLALNPVVHYACEIVIYPDKLTIGDAIILHSLGVLWRHPHN